MELKPPKPKKKSNIARLISWGRMFKTPLLILFLLGTTNCELDSDSDIDKTNFPSDLSKSNTNIKSRGIDDELLKLNLELNVTQHNFLLPSNRSKRIRHGHRVQPEKNKLAQIRYLRRHMNKVMLNFVMSDVLIDGEVENRVHFNGVTAKETFVNADGNGLRLRQLTDGRHLVQVIYNQNGVLQDCEYITQGKTARNFLKTLRKELKQALDEETYKIMDKSNNIQEEFEKEKFYRHFGNVTLRILKNGEKLPPDVATWFDYDRLKMECLKKHEEIKYVMENNNKASGVSLARYRRSFRENFILPGTKWCGAGQLAEDYSELGAERAEDRCCRAHDNCRRNIGQFRRRFGIFNFRPYTISHCRCDRRFRACLKLADTSVSNMVGKLFFNVVQTKCFILKPVKTCTQRSWWGKCLRRGYAKQAFLRDNLPY